MCPMRFGRWATFAAALLTPLPSLAQVSYLARFEMEKPTYLMGEPIFSKFTIRNTGSQTFQFVFRTPSRVLARELESEPRFRLTGAARHLLPDPAPKPCGGAAGTVVYGSVTLPPGQAHTERWLLDQWARFTSPGRYRVHAERRLPLFALDPRTQQPSKRPVAYALALDELSFELVPATDAQLRSTFQPFLETLRDPKKTHPAEAMLVITTLPKPFFLSELVAAASPSSADRWDRKLALEGLARLGTPAAWKAILAIAQGKNANPASPEKDGSLRAYAILLLAEKGNAAFLPPMLEMVSKVHGEVRDSLLRALGFFQDPRAHQALFDQLHSESSTDRMNAILGLKNLGTKETIPALMAMLNDPEPQVRQVANFALAGLTGKKFALSNKASPEEAARLAADWHAWWRQNAASFFPPRPPSCREW